MIKSTDEVLVKSKPIHFWLIEKRNEGKILQAFYKKLINRNLKF